MKVLFVDHPIPLFQKLLMPRVTNKPMVNAKLCKTIDVNAFSERTKCMEKHWAFHFLDSAPTASTISNPYGQMDVGGIFAQICLGLKGHSIQK